MSGFKEMFNKHVQNFSVTTPEKNHPHFCYNRREVSPSFLLHSRRNITLISFYNHGVVSPSFLLQPRRKKSPSFTPSSNCKQEVIQTAVSQELVVPETGSLVDTSLNTLIFTSKNQVDLYPPSLSS